MAFGNSVTEFDQMAIGTIGYILRADTTSILAYEIEGIQAQSSSTSTGAPSSFNVKLSDLSGYVNDITAPDLAFSYEPGEVYMFFKTSIYPFSTDTRFSLLYKRSPLKMITADDNMDIQDEDLELFTAYAIKHACLLLSEPVPFLVSETIRIKEEEIKNANS